MFDELKEPLLPSHSADEADLANKWSGLDERWKQEINRVLGKLIHFVNRWDTRWKNQNNEQVKLYISKAEIKLIMIGHYWSQKIEFSCAIFSKEENIGSHSQSNF
ncbi:hypothetical protein [Paenibacillus sp. NAIST15-1]|uniref:hypothetical protein n=1 Tax=Paenibacillus sp. NAIST15-1 TaxID=1605994 RepID=UPI000932AFF8|nr:hypothetical protein [Paenibacillus sp. NAIST15-1]